MSQGADQTIPAGWELAKLGALGEWSGGGTPSKENAAFWSGGSIPWVSPKDMKVHRIRDSEDSITEEAVRASATKLIPPGSVLMVTRSGILARTLPVGINDVAVTVNQDLKCLTPRRGVLPDYVAYGLKAFELRILKDCSKHGTTVASIDFPRLKEFSLPLAPPDEQKSIVDALDSYFSRLDDVEAGLERVQRNLKRYRASVLQAAVTGRLVPTEAELARVEGREYEPASEWVEKLVAVRPQNERARRGDGSSRGSTPTSAESLPQLPDGWCWTTVEAVGAVLLGRRRAPEYRGALRPYLRVANVGDDRIDASVLREMPFSEAEFRLYQLRPGDILVSEGQSVERIGQGAIYHGGIPGLCFQSTLHRFRPLEGGPSPEYSQIVFRSHVRSGVFRRHATITTNIAHLVLRSFRSVPFPLPPRAEQERICAAVGRLLSIADEAELQATVQQARLTRLRQSILGSAFAGQLES